MYAEGSSETIAPTYQTVTSAFIPVWHSGQLISALTKAWEMSIQKSRVRCSSRWTLTGVTLGPPMSVRELTLMPAPVNACTINNNNIYHSKARSLSWYHSQRLPVCQLFLLTSRHGNGICRSPLVSCFSPCISLRDRDVYGRRGGQEVQEDWPWWSNITQLQSARNLDLSGVNLFWRRPLCDVL